MEQLNIVFCTHDALDDWDLLQLRYLCKTNHDFVIVKHKANTLYINQKHPNSSRIAEAVRQFWPVENLDDNGDYGFSLLTEIERLSNSDAASLVLHAWSDMRDREHRVNMQSRAAEWLATYQEPLEVEENDIELLRAIYRGAGLAAVFAFGYQCGKRSTAK